MAQVTPEQAGLSEFSPRGTQAEELQFLIAYYIKLLQTQGISIDPGDIEIGAVEIKNGTTDDRAVVDTSGAISTNVTKVASTAAVSGGTAGTFGVGGIQADDVAVSGNNPALVASVTADPASLPADTVAGRVKRFLSNLKGILYVLQANLSYTTDSAAIIGKVVTGASGITQSRNTGATNTATAVKASAGSVFDVTVINPNAAIEYIKFFDVAAASVVVGTTVPKYTRPIAASSALLMSNEIRAIFEFSTAVSYIVTSVLADTGAQTAPSTALHVDIGYV